MYDFIDMNTCQNKFIIKDIKALVFILMLIFHIHLKIQPFLKKKNKRTLFNILTIHMERN